MYILYVCIGIAISMIITMIISILSASVVLHEERGSRPGPRTRTIC